MQNKNNWNVSYSTIRFFEDALNSHNKVTSVKREKDIFFTITDIRGRTFNILLVDEYRMGIAALIKAKSEFANVEYIVIGGEWNKCTIEAKEYGLGMGINILNFKGVMGAINCENPKYFRGAEVSTEIED